MISAPMAAPRHITPEISSRVCSLTYSGLLAVVLFNDAFRVRGAAYSDHKYEFENAIADCTAAIRLKPDYAEAYLTRGRGVLASGAAMQRRRSPTLPKPFGSSRNTSRHTLLAARRTATTTTLKRDSQTTRRRSA